MHHNQQQQQHPNNNNNHNGDKNDTTCTSSDTSNPTTNTGQQQLQYPSLLGFFLLYVHTEEVVFRPLISLLNCYQPGTLLKRDDENEENENSGEEILLPITDLDNNNIALSNNNSGNSTNQQQQQVQKKSSSSNMSNNNNKTGASYNSPLSSSSSPQLLSIDDERLLRRLELDEQTELPQDDEAAAAGVGIASIRTLLLLGGGEEMTGEVHQQDPTTTSSLSRNGSNHQFAEQILVTIGNLLNSADRELTHLQKDDGENDNTNNSLLGTALVRSCQEFADMISNLAEQLEEQTSQDDERQALAEACLQDFGSLQMHEEGEGGNNNNTTAKTANLVQDDQQMRPPSHDDFHNAIVGAAELLRDVESSLRAIEQEEADEIADVALSTAHLFVASLQHIHAQITPQQLAKSMDHDASSSASAELKDHPNIELIIEDDDDDTDKERRRRSLRSSTGSTTETNNMQRMRCLWPPVGPAVQNVLQWSKQELSQRHWLLTAALGITMWPAAVITTLVGTPTLVADHVLQSAYNHYQNTPLIATAEVAAAQMYQTTILALLSAKIVSKPTIRVAKRQWERHHTDVQDWFVHKFTHPVDTVVETTHGLLWCTKQFVNVVQDQIDKFQQQQELQKQQNLQI